MQKSKMKKLNLSYEAKNLIHEINIHNFTLKSLEQSIQSYLALTKTEQSRNKPKISAEISNTTSLEKNTYKQKTKNLSLGLSLNWTLDIFGKIADEIKATQLEYKQAKLHYIHTKRELFAEALGLHTDLIYYDNALKNNLEQKDILKILYSSQKEAYIKGLTAFREYMEAKTAFEKINHQTEALHVEYMQVLYALNILRGSDPKKKLSLKQYPLSKITLNEEFTINATDLNQRADLQSSFLTVKILQNKESATYKALLPQITLSGQYATTGQKLNELFNGNFIWQFIGGITQPIFNAEELNSLAKSKSKEVQSSYFKYQEKVLNAIKEIDETLAQINLLKKQNKIYQSELNNTIKSLHSQERKYKSMQINLSEYLEEKLTWLQIKQNLEKTNAQYIKLKIKLALLGGILAKEEINNVQK